MNPNKLPTLPAIVDCVVESAMKIHCPEGKWLTGPDTFSIVIATDLTEALRQSQSLPDGAVADDDWNDWFETWATNRGMVMQLTDDGRFLSPDTSLAQRAHEAGCMTTHIYYMELCRQEELEKQAFQADAREKGEAEYPEAAIVCAEAYQVVGCLLDQLGLFETEEGQKILDNLSQQRLVHKDVLPWGWTATQPAQASEKDNG